MEQQKAQQGSEALQIKRGASNAKELGSCCTKIKSKPSNATVGAPKRAIERKEQPQGTASEEKETAVSVPQSDKAAALEIKKLATFDEKMRYKRLGDLEEIKMCKGEKIAEALETFKENDEKELAQTLTKWECLHATVVGETMPEEGFLAAVVEAKKEAAQAQGRLQQHARLLAQLKSLSTTQDWEDAPWTNNWKDADGEPEKENEVLQEMMLKVWKTGFLKSLEESGEGIDPKTRQFVEGLRVVPSHAHDLRDAGIQELTDDQRHQILKAATHSGTQCDRCLRHCPYLRPSTVDSRLIVCPEGDWKLARDRADATEALATAEAEEMVKTANQTRAQVNE